VFAAKWIFGSINEHKNIMKIKTIWSKVTTPYNIEVYFTFIVDLHKFHIKLDFHVIELFYDVYIITFFSYKLDYEKGTNYLLVNDIKCTHEVGYIRQVFSTFFFLYSTPLFSNATDIKLWSWMHIANKHFNQLFHNQLLKLELCIKHTVRV
jgi:hypothetical protein